jgi:hypothetical protein
MEKTKEIEFSRLLGFAAVREQISGDVSVMRRSAPNLGRR